MPHRSSVSQPWRLQGTRYRLEGTECLKCKNTDFPSRKTCSECESSEIAVKNLSGEGVVESFTIIHTAPEGFEHQTPYTIGLVRLREGPVITTQIVGDLKDLAIGKKVKAVFRKLYEQGEAGLIHYGFKFELSG